MADVNEEIAGDPWVSWHKITGEKISGPAPMRLNPGKNSSDGEIIPPSRIYRHSRPKFHKMLSDQAERIGISPEYGKRVNDYYEETSAGKAGVILENGEKIEADVVIAADGIGSKSTRITMGQEIRARSTGYSIYRASFPVELALADPLVRERFPLLEDGTPNVELWMGFVYFQSPFSQG